MVLLAAYLSRFNNRPEVIVIELLIRTIPAALNSQCLFHTLKDTVNKKLDTSLDFADKAVVYPNFLFLCAIFHFDRIMDYYFFNQRV